MSKNQLTSQYSAREIKKLIQSRKEKSKYETQRVIPSLEAAEQRFAPAAMEFAELERSIRKLYYSGDKKDPVETSIKKKHLDMFIDKTYKKSVEKSRYEWDRLPRISEFVSMRGKALPMLYTTREMNPNSIDGLISIWLPKMFIYSGEVKPFTNLLRKSGLIHQKPYMHEWLNTIYDEPVVVPWKGPYVEEKEILTYLYDMFPYAYRFAGDIWISAVARTNNSISYATGMRDVEPMTLRTSEHIRISSRQIPFEIEGNLIVTDIDELVDIILRYRSKENYNYCIGETDKPSYVPLHLFFTKVCGKDPDLVEQVLKSPDFEAAESDEIAEHKVPDNKCTDIEETMWYYATDDERIELSKKIHISERIKKSIELSRELGLRTAFYSTALSASDREGVNEQYHQFLAKEDALLLEGYNRYGINIRRDREEIMDSIDDIFNSEDEDGPTGIFDLITEQDEQQCDEGNYYEPDTIVFTESLQTWKDIRDDPVGPSRTIWDPGGTHTSAEVEKPRAAWPRERGPFEWQ